MNEKPSHLPSSSLSPLQQAILFTVIYADLFDFPLTSAEIHRDLAGGRDLSGDFQAALDSLIGVRLSVSAGYLTLPGREALAGLRRQRRGTGRSLWGWAVRFGRLLACVPFVRLIAVSGSLAVDNTGPGLSDKTGGEPVDIDYFIITERGRLWIARFWLVLLRLISRRLTHSIPAAICPNYLLSLDALEVDSHNLYTAHEVVQIVPLWGEKAYTQFLQANSWVREFLPRFVLHDQVRFLPGSRPPRLVDWVEQLLAGKAGDILDRGLYRFFCLFHRYIRAYLLARRLEPDRGRRPLFRRQYLQSVKTAFRPERQILIQDGYAEVVRLRFYKRVQEILGDQIPASDLDRLFPPVTGPEAALERLYNQVHHVQAFQQRYGGAG